MGFLTLFQRKQKNTQAITKNNISLGRAADSILNQRGKQIVDGLSKTTASTGTPMDKLHGGAKKMAQISNIGGGSKATGGGGVDEGMKAMLQHCKKDGVAEREGDFRQEVILSSPQRSAILKPLKKK